MAAITAPAITPADIEALLPLVRGHVLTKYRRIHDPDDLIQAGMLAVCQAAHRWKPTGGASFKSYAFNRARGAVIDHIRSQRAGTRLHPVEEPLPLNVDQLVTVDDNNLLWADIERQLNPRDLRTIRLHAAGVTLREIGDGEGITESRVCQRVSRIRAQLKPWADAA